MSGATSAASKATAAAATATTAAVTATARTAAPSFPRRSTFALPSTLPRSYFLGHHAAGLARMRTLLSTVDLVLEVRDFRAPLTSRNPLLEQALQTTSSNGGGGPRARIVVYTKRDLGAAWARGPGSRGAAIEDELRRRLHRQSSSSADGIADGDGPAADDVFFLAHASSSSSGSSVPRAYTPAALLERIRQHAASRFSVTGTRVLVAGMPNVGKSTLLNGLRAASSVRSSRTGRRGKVAATGGMPGVTRSVGGPVKILEGWEVDGLPGPPSPPPPPAHPQRGATHNKSNTTSTANGGNNNPRHRNAVSEPVYIHDTPGVFMPYVPSGIAMLKLALCGAVKEGLVPAPTLTDYLLFRLNAGNSAGAYAGLLPRGAGPTDDVHVFLDGVARHTGRLLRGGRADVEAAAVWVVQQWRRGEVGRVMLDDVFAPEGDAEAAEAEVEGVLRDEAGEPISMNQARKAEKERRRERTRVRLRARKGMD